MADYGFSDSSGISWILMGFSGFEIFQIRRSPLLLRFQISKHGHKVFLFKKKCYFAL